MVSRTILGLNMKYKAHFYVKRTQEANAVSIFHEYALKSVKEQKTVVSCCGEHRKKDEMQNAVRK